MKQRRRYIAFEVVGIKSREEVSQAVNSLRANQPKTARAAVKLVLYDASSQRGLLRCNHHQLDEIKASMTRGECGKVITFRVIGISGTIRAAKRKFLASRQAKG